MTTLELSKCHIGQDVEKLAGLLTNCPTLPHLDLRSNTNILYQGAYDLPGLGQCSTLTHLNLGANMIGDLGTERLAPVPTKFSSLAHLDLTYDNHIGSAGTKILVSVLPPCPVLSDLRLHRNQIGPEEANSLAEVIVKWRALTPFDLDNNDIKSTGSESVWSYGYTIMLASLRKTSSVLLHLNVSLFITRGKTRGTENTYNWVSV